MMQLTINLPDDFFDQALAESVAKIASQANRADEFPPFMDKGTAAKFLGCSRGTLDKWIRNENLPFIKIDGMYRFSKEKLILWLNNHEM